MQTWIDKDTAIPRQEVKGLGYKPCMKKLAEYEGLEEQELLLKLPCKVGDIAWELCLYTDNKYRIFPMVVKSVSEYGSSNFIDKRGIPVV